MTKSNVKSNAASVALKVEEFDMKTSKAVAAAMYAAMLPVASALGIEVRQHGGQLGNGLSFVMKFQAALKPTKGNRKLIADKEQESWNLWCSKFGLGEHHYGMTLNHNGKPYTLFGFAPKRTKFPIQVRAEDGKVILLTVDEVVSKVGAVKGPKKLAGKKVMVQVDDSDDDLDLDGTVDTDDNDDDAAPAKKSRRGKRTPATKVSAKKPVTKKGAAFAAKMAAARAARKEEREAAEAKSSKRNGKKVVTKVRRTRAELAKEVKSRTKMYDGMTAAEKRAKAERAAVRAERKAKRERAAKREARKSAKPAKRTAKVAVKKTAAKSKRRNRMG